MTREDSPPAASMPAASPADQPSPPIVMKFGGSSVADLERLGGVAEIIATRARERPVVVVVSAMGKTTDGLVSGARELCDPPAPRELDMLLTTGERHSMAMLALALHGRGVSAISLTGSQCGIITDHQHGRARIVEVRPFRIFDELAAGHVVVVGGFQGVSYKREVTTLGRGGSDTTAVALAAALAADCEIYSDVDGVYDSDPRRLPEAARIDELGYREMQALSRAGAKVLHAQAVQLAAERGIAIYARATFPKPGRTGQTVIRQDPKAPTGVRAVTCDAVVELRLELADPASSPTTIGLLALHLNGLGLRYLQVDERGASGLVSLGQRDDLGALQQVIARVLAALSARSVTVDRVVHRGDLALVSCIGAGLEERLDVIERALSHLQARSIDLLGTRTDGQSLAFLVDGKNAEAATRALHTGLIRNSGHCATNV